MKRIIDGVTYNTDTSTRLAASAYDGEYNHQDVHCEGVLYQTRGGAFFVVETMKLFEEENGEPYIRHRFVALSREEAQRWLFTGEVEVFNNAFEDPPEAEAEAEPSATIFVRLPQSLKGRLEEGARADGVSLNAAAIRCFESCLEKRRQDAMNCLGTLRT